MKRCNWCNIQKPRSAFSRQVSIDSRTGKRRSKDGLQYYCKACCKLEKIQDRYGITPEQYEKIQKQQHGLCAICGVPLTLATRPCVDHNHATGQVRGLLCNSCNVFIAHSRESVATLHKAIRYLQEWEKR